MRNYEVTFIVDPVLSGDEIKATAQKYVGYLEKAGCKIVHIDEMGLVQLAYPINKRSSGIYYCIEFETPSGVLIDDLELTFRRDENVMRYLTVKLDKYGVKYNEDKRTGKISKYKKKKPAEKPEGATRPASVAAFEEDEDEIIAPVPKEISRKPAVVPEISAEEE